MAASRLIPVRVGDIEIEVESVPVAGTEATSGRAVKAAGNVLEAFGRAQDAIIEVAKSTAEMIEKAGAAARPDRVDVEFGLKFSASGGVIMAGVAGEASLKVTLGYDIGSRPAAAQPDSALPAAAPDQPPAELAVTGAAGGPDGRVPGYLGRVLDAGSPVGTCFQVAPGVLVTAWHVLEDIGSAAVNAGVRVDPLAGGDRFEATVERVDPARDLAVLTSGAGLPTVCGRLTATDRMTLGAKVTVTGHAVLDDPGHAYLFLDAVGEWAGGTTRDDAVPLGRMTCSAVVPGMSGAPVICAGEGAVAGVVSGRYNSADGWLAGTVWVARTEDLAALLDGIAAVTMRQAPLAGPVGLLLTVTADRVRLTGSGVDVSAAHGGVRSGLAESVYEARRARARMGQVLAAPLPAGERAGDLSLARAGRLLGESFLSGPVAAELDRMLAAAERAYQPVRLGLDVAAELAWLPWEALPRADGRGRLALHPLVSLYRKTEAAAARRLPGPLRIVVAIAAPQDSGGGLVDYERHLRSVIAEVRSARQDDADVRVVPFAALSAIREELQRPRHTCCTSTATAARGSWNWKTRTARRGRWARRSSWPRRSRQARCHR